MKQTLLVFLVIGVAFLIFGGKMLLAFGYVFIFYMIPILFVYIFIEEEFFIEEEKSKLFKGRLRKLILYCFWLFYAKIGFDLYLYPDSSAINAIISLLRGDDPFPLVREGAKLIYPLSCALIVRCQEEKCFWFPRLDPSSSSLILLLPILSCYLFIPFICLFTYEDGVNWLINLISSLLPQVF